MSQVYKFDNYLTDNKRQIEEDCDSCEMTLEDEQQMEQILLNDKEGKPYACLITKKINGFYERAINVYPDLKSYEDKFFIYYYVSNTAKDSLIAKLKERRDTIDKHELEYWLLSKDIYCLEN